MAKRLPLILTLVLFVAAGAVFAELQTVLLKSGRQVTGEVAKTSTGYQVTTPNGVINVASGDVASIGPATDPDAEFKDRLSKIDPKNADDHVALAEWAFSRGMMDDAQGELKAALAINANHLKAQLLLRKVEAALADAAKSEPQPATSTSASGPSAAENLDKILIPMDDIYRIRLAELRRDDTVAVEFKNDLIERFITRMQGSPPDFTDPKNNDQFRAKPRPEQALRIRKEFENNSNPGKWLDDIIIKSDPKFMIEFRSRVLPSIRGHCAAADCHGGEKGQGRLKLFSTPSNDRVDYTNFVIMDGFKNSAGRLIDRDIPDDSLLLQFGLPVEQVKVRHPKTIRWVFTSRQTQQYRNIDDWMSKTLQPTPHPDYRLKWTPPAGVKLDFGISTIDFGPISRPATNPTGK